MKRTAPSAPSSISGNAAKRRGARSTLLMMLPRSGLHGFRLLGGRRFRTFQGREELIDAEGLVENESQAVLASLDQRVRRVVAVGRHEDDAGFGLGLPQVAVDLIAAAVGQANVGEDKIVAAEPG